ncbi:MAG: hypothetical protein AB7K36_08360 [Chloroflexota bacterium]
MTQPSRTPSRDSVVDAVANDRPGLCPVAVSGAILWSLALACLLFYLLVYVAHSANLAAYPYDLDQGEGYDLNSGWLLAQGRPIYTDNSQYPYYSSNYPPVYSVILASIVAQTGPTLAAGRLLSAAAALLTALVIAVIVYRQTGNGVASLTAGLLFISSNYVFHTTPLVRVNALALLFALGGVACCLVRGAAWTAGAIVLFLLALFTKQTTLDAVAAGLLALTLRDVRLGVLAGVTIGFVGGAGMLFLDTVHEGAFWLNVVVGNVNPFDVQQALDYYLNFVQLHLVVVALAAWHLVRAVRQRRVSALEIYLMLSLGLAISVGKWGAGESYFLAPIAASAVLAGLSLAQLHRQGESKPWLLVGIGGLLTVQALLFSHGPLYRLGPLFADRGAQASVLSRWPGQSEVSAAADLVTLLRNAEGPVLLEDPSYGLVAGKEVVGNATHLRNLYQAGAWSPDSLVDDVRERRFSWVVLDAQLYPEPVLAAIGKYYYLYETYEINGTTQQLFAPGAE